MCVCHWLLVILSTAAVISQDHRSVTSRSIFGPISSCGPFLRIDAAEALHHYNKATAKYSHSDFGLSLQRSTTKTTDLQTNSATQKKKIEMSYPSIISCSSCGRTVHSTSSDHWIVRNAFLAVGITHKSIQFNAYEILYFVSIYICLFFCCWLLADMQAWAT